MRSGCRRVDPLRAKKLHVLAACEVERHRKRTLGGGGPARQVRRATYRGLTGVRYSEVRLPEGEFCLAAINIAPTKDVH